MKTRHAALIAVMVAACAGDARNAAVPDDGAAEQASDSATIQSPDGAPTQSGAPGSQDYPAAVPASWDIAALPPADALIREGACPFECCQYGEWWSDSATAVHRTPRDTTELAFTLPPRTPVVAETGTVFVTSLARVVFDAPMSEEQIGVPGVGALTPADTLYPIEPVGEGAFIVWMGGGEQELPGIWESYYPGTTARREGEYAHDWWARVRTEDGRTGWIWMDRTRAPMWGADACGGEHPLPRGG